ncbi:MAG: hypothetical protein L6Q54_06665 [Leptospiraceae bacterium]|nr:hypothetical protein [Leptospiraceae bacterium]MCK6380919.1 hypothetical protein [Leptospiraceae bacterium]
MELKDKIKEFLNNSEKLERTIGSAIDCIFFSEINNLLPEKINIDLQALSLLSNKNSELDKKIGTLEHEKIITVNSFHKLINEESLLSISELASVPGYEPSKEFLLKVLNQKPIVELLAGIIESAIIEFNKKINPFFGAIQATGLDKQIKLFVYPFLPGLLSKIADFIFNSPKGEEGRELIRNTIKIFLTAEFSEFKSPTPNELEEIKSNFLVLKESILKDSVFTDSMQNIYTSLRQHILQGSKSKNLREFLGMSEDDYSLFRTNLAKQLAKNIIDFKNRESLEQTIFLVVSEIVG